MFAEGKPLENSPFNRKFGIVPEDRADGTVCLRLEADPSFRNEVNVVHGGLAMMLLDGAMGRCAVRHMGEGERCATVQISVLFLAAAEGVLTATAHVVRRGKKIAFLEGECVRADGTIVAKAHGTWSIGSARKA